MGKANRDTVVICGAERGWGFWIGCVSVRLQVGNVESYMGTVGVVLVGDTGPEFVVFCATATDVSLTGRSDMVPSASGWYTVPIIKHFPLLQMLWHS